MCQSVPSRGKHTAFSAGTRAVLSDLQVHPFIGVSLRAVGLSEVLGGVSISAKKVLSHRDSFQMAKIYADSVPAEVIDGKAFGNLTDIQFVRNTMCYDWLGMTHREVSIASLGTKCPSPGPAGLIPTGAINLTPESLFQGKRGVSPGTLPPFVVHEADAPRMVFPLTVVDNTQSSCHT